MRVFTHVFQYSPKPKIGQRCMTIHYMTAHFRGLCALAGVFLHDFAGGWGFAPHVFCQMNNNFLIKQPNSTGSRSNCPFYPIALGSLHIWNYLNCWPCAVEFPLIHFSSGLNHRVLICWKCAWCSWRIKNQGSGECCFRMADCWVDTQISFWTFSTVRITDVTPSGLRLLRKTLKSPKQGKIRNLRRNHGGGSLLPRTDTLAIDQVTCMEPNNMTITD